MFGRDQTRNAVSPEKNPPLWWQLERRDEDGNLRHRSKNVRWSAPLGNRTYGDPVVVDGLVWVGTNSGIGTGSDAAILVCLEEHSGKELYRYVSRRLGYDHNTVSEDWSGHSLACSPLIESDRMWFTTNRGEVVCLDISPLKRREGEPRPLWKVDLRKELGVILRGCHHGHRLCSIASYRELIYVITGNGIKSLFTEGVAAPDAPSLVCFNKNTGQVVWQDNSPGHNILLGQYASPTVIEVNGQAQVVAPQGDGWVRSFDAVSGQLLWEFDTNPPGARWDFGGLGTRNHLPASAVFHDNRIYIGNGREPEAYTGPAWLYCIDPSKTGDISPYLADGPGKGKPNPNSGMVWKFGGTDRLTKNDIFERTLSNVAIHDGLVIAPGIGGVVHCLDARSGRQLWALETGEAFWGSPLIVDGKIYVGSEVAVWILDLSRELKVLDRIEIVESTVSGLLCSPIFANGVLYLATNDRLFAIVSQEKKPRLRPVAVVDPQVTQKWLADLDHDRFEVRERAHAELLRLGEGVIPALRQTLEEKPPLEVIRRVDAVLEQLTWPSPEYWEMVGEIQTLERIATAEARQLLESLAQGATGARQTIEAQNTLKRLAEQSAAR